MFEYCMFHTLDLPPHLTFLWLLLSRTSSGKNKSKGNVSGDYNSLLQSSWLPPTRNFHDVNEKWGRNCPRSGSWRRACFLPSGDGTYQTWVSVDLDPQSKDVYSCHVEHCGRQIVFEAPQGKCGGDGCLGSEPEERG